MFTRLGQSLPRFSLSFRKIGTMKAAILEKPNSPFIIEKIKIPEPKSGEALIRIKAVGVCHSDLHVINGDSAMKFPNVIGHEVCGEIVDFGPGTETFLNNMGSKDLKKGQKVVVSFIMPCGFCRHCVRGRDDMCDAFFKYSRSKGVLYDGTTRLHRADGTPLVMFSMAGLAEYAAIPATSLIPLPSSPHLPYADVAIMGCAVMTAYGAIKNGGLQIGESVLVIGAGGIGQNCIQLAKAFGAPNIIAADIDQGKLEFCDKFGATHKVNTQKEDLKQKVLEITGGKGVEMAIECIGRPATFKQAVSCTTEGGRAVMVGVAKVGEVGEVEIAPLVRRQIKIIGSYGGKPRQDIPALLDLVQAGKINISLPITDRFSGLEQADLAYQTLKKGQMKGRGLITLF